MDYLGAHMSIAGGVFNAPYHGQKATCEVIQIFTKSNNQWQAKPLSGDDIEKYKAACEDTGIAVACAHDSYLINLASPDDALFEKSCRAFVEEMRRCDLLDIPNLVMHPGSHVGSGEAAGLARITGAFRRILDVDPDGRVTVCLETTAGQGSNLGYSFEHLAEIIHGLDGHPRLGVCLDTCHVFAAGYGITDRKDYLKTMRDFDRIIGLDRLRIIHMNDSRREAGSRVDRHDNIGEGHIGLDAFANFLNDRRLKKIPKILETPKTSAAEDIRNLNVLRSLIKRRGGKSGANAVQMKGTP